jgi:predicted DCC family thiol-disulfide oxidoreductase YuxK
VEEAQKSQPKSNPIILFDGVCNLCNASVQFIIRNDPKSTFRFASLQSDAGKAILNQFSVPPEKLYSVLVVYEGHLYDRSRAALEIARRLKGLWSLLYGFIIIPPFIRNFIYDWISRNRYRWFGVRQECMMPTPDMKARFIQ